MSALTPDQAFAVLTETQFEIFGFADTFARAVTGNKTIEFQPEACRVIAHDLQRLGVKVGQLAGYVAPPPPPSPGRTAQVFDFPVPSPALPAANDGGGDAA